MSNAFAKRLRGYAPLEDDDVSLLLAACRNIREVPTGHHLIREGDEPDPVFVILEGWACGYKILPDGGRQILAFLMPGDFCDIHIAVLKAIDHSIITLTPARVAMLPQRQMEGLVESRPAITRAFWWSQLVDQGVLRAWIAGMGRRNSQERVAHLMCQTARKRDPLSALKRDPLFEMVEIVVRDALRWVRWRPGVARPEAHPAQVGSEGGVRVAVNCGF